MKRIAKLKDLGIIRNNSNKENNFQEGRAKFLPYQILFRSCLPITK